MDFSICQKDIETAQRRWGDNLVRIGKIFRENGDYKEAVIKFVEKFYAYDSTQVLFKPTLASLYQFRLTKDSAISYFMGGNPQFPRDTGFALKPWEFVRFENSGFIFMEKYSISMGNYFFKDLDGREVKVEYSIGYFRNEDGDIKINLHHSSLPYNPKPVSKT
ncbi:MAG: hypothetical protein JXR31_12055 [Prolixibacteraceae bacterium]|nr:hypothetical protein [Prolixibacteraceae bacterium]MBN2774979.1 hypothetical protein [Prolixibacteraceae bacterium]